MENNSGNKTSVLKQVFNRFLANFNYFNTNNLTLKQFLIFGSFLISIGVFAQDFNNIEFIENKGQWDSRVQYRGNISNGAFFIRNAGFTVVQHNPAELSMLARFNHGFDAAGNPLTANDKFTLHSHAWNVDFVGASSKVETVPDKKIDTYNNYFIGNDKTKWADNCKIYQAITLKDVYPNVDVRYYTDNSYLKYDIIVKPGGDISKIALRYDGVDKLQVKNKELAISTSVGELKESSPYTFQSTSNGKTEISCKYIVKDNVVKFEVKNYDPTRTLVIDPIVVFGSFSGSTSDNWGFTATYGPDGSMYGGGIVFDDGGSFPVSPGAFQTLNGGGTASKFDMGIIKLSPNGSNRIYATYIGGSDKDQPHSLIVDNLGQLIIAGRSNSSNYPVVNPGGQVGLGGSWDIVVTKLNATGTALIGSKKIGGTGDDGVNITDQRGLNSLQRNYGDDGRSEVILDGAGNVYIASSTQSNNFPVTAGAFQPGFGGGLQDAVLLKLTPTLSAVSFASYFGGTLSDAGYVLSIAPDQSIYMAGGTESGDLPGPTAGTIGPISNGGIDGFVCRIANNGSSIIRTTYIGTNAIDQVFGVQFDSRGFPYIMGQTTGNWPVSNAPYSNANGKQFICKMQPDLSAYVYSTCFGSGAATPNISPIAFLVDRCENVYISGWGGFFFTSNSFNSAGTGGLPITPDALKSATDGKDLYFFVLKKDAASQLFGSFYGENNSSNGGSDHVDGGTSRFDKDGVIYQAICGNCKLNQPPVNPIPDLVTNGAWSTTNNSGNCNLTMIKIAMNLAGVNGDVQSAINGVPRDTSGCINMTIDFRDTVGTAQSYEWWFNYTAPGGTAPDLITSTPNTSHTYLTVGNYRVMLVAVDPNTCNIRDTSYVIIRIGDRKSLPDFDFAKLPPCTAFSYDFNNLSVPVTTTPFTNTAFIWDFGDGSPRVIRDTSNIIHNFPAPGTYNVKLVLTDTNYCNAPDSIVKAISVASLVKASFTTPATGCLPYNAVFKNTSVGGQTWIWEFGDGTTSTAFEPVHLYAVAGTYNIRLIANNPNTCNGTDTSAFFTINVFDSPSPDFNFAPLVPIDNTPTTFTNLSSPDAIKFKWEFGDGDSLVTTSRASVTHQYNATGTFKACLTAYNLIGCDSTICKQVKATIVALVDVPNAFTPNSNDQNNLIFVRGFGISKMQWVIWNRWGQKVFETNSRFQGWDGKVKGVVQPMDVYAYTLSVEYFDGSKTTKKGDITLIR